MKSWEEMRQDIRNNPKLNDAQKAELLKEIDDYERADERYKKMTDEEKDQFRKDMDDIIWL